MARARIPYRVGLRAIRQEALEQVVVVESRLPYCPTNFFLDARMIALDIALEISEVRQENRQMLGADLLRDR